MKTILKRYAQALIGSSVFGGLLTGSYFGARTLIRWIESFDLNGEYVGYGIASFVALTWLAALIHFLDED